MDNTQNGGRAKLKDPIRGDETNWTIFNFGSKGANILDASLGGANEIGRFIRRGN